MAKPMDLGYHVRESRNNLSMNCQVKGSRYSVRVLENNLNMNGQVDESRVFG